MVSIETNISPDQPAEPRRTLFAGDFSAGKSTCINLMLRRRACETSVVSRRNPVATQVFTAGNDDAGLQSSALLETSELQLSSVEDFENQGFVTLSQIDHLVWCTIGSQAWRSSEQGVLEAIRRDYAGPATLVVTRSDLYRSGEDRRKVEARLRHEAMRIFDQIVFIGAPNSNHELLDDDQSWRAAGGVTLRQAIGFAGELRFDPAKPAQISEARSNPTYLDGPPESAPTASALPELERVRGLFSTSIPRSEALAPDVAVDPARSSILSTISDMVGFEALAAFDQASNVLTDHLNLSETEATGFAGAVNSMMRADGSDQVEHLIINMKQSYIVLARFLSTPTHVVAVRFRKEGQVPEASRRQLVALLS